MIADKYIATATKNAEWDYGLTEGEKYEIRIESGLTCIYDLSGNFLRTGRIDDFTNYTLLE